MLTINTIKLNGNVERDASEASGRKKCGGSLVRASNADYKPADLLEIDAI